MSKPRFIVFISLAVTIALGATSAAAQQGAANRLIGPESFPGLELSEDRAIDFAGNAEDPDGEFGDIQGWMRLWRDPVGGGGLVAMAAEMDAETSEAFLAGFQSTVPAEDRAEHPTYPDVVTLATVNPLDEPTLAAAFSEGSAVFILIAEGTDRQALLDRAISAQLAMIETPLLEQSAGLAEDLPTAGPGSPTSEIIIWAGFVIVLVFLATWAIRRSVRRRFGDE